MLRRSFWISAAIASAVLGGCASPRSQTKPADPVTVRADNPAVQFSGRATGIGTNTVTLGWSGARIRLRFEGSSSVGVWLDDDSGENHAMVWIDGAAGKRFRLNTPGGFYPLADGLDAGEHTVEIVRVTEGFLGLTQFRGFALDPSAKALPWSTTPDRRIEFIGDSITCGYGVEVDDPSLHFDPATENFCLGYSGLTARALNADTLVVARSGIGMVRNYDGPYDGSQDAMPQVYPHTFYLKPEMDWDFSRFTPDVVCVNLGTNDFSTTGVNVEKFVATYRTFVDMLLTGYPHARVVILQGPMHNGEGLRSALAKVVDGLRGEDSSRVHFLALTPQGSVGLGADYHPNRAQSQINAAELTAFLSKLMDWR